MPTPTVPTIVNLIDVTCGEKTTDDVRRSYIVNAFDVALYAVYNEYPDASNPSIDCVFAKQALDNALCYLSPAAQARLHTSLFVIPALSIHADAEKVMQERGLSLSFVHNLITLSFILKEMHINTPSDPWVIKRNPCDVVIRFFANDAVVPIVIQRHLAAITRISPDPWAHRQRDALMAHLCQLCETYTYIWLACSYQHFLPRLYSLIESKGDDPTQKHVQRQSVSRLYAFYHANYRHNPLRDQGIFDAIKSNIEDFCKEESINPSYNI